MCNQKIADVLAKNLNLLTTQNRQNQNQNRHLVKDWPTVWLISGVYGVTAQWLVAQTEHKHVLER